MAALRRLLSRQHGSRTFTTIALVLFLGGASLIGYGASHQDHAPQPPSSAAGSLADPAASAPAPTLAPRSLPTPPSAPRSAIPPSQPVSIDIPSIDVRSEVIQVGLNPDHTIATPQPGPDYNKAAWYKYSPTPGQTGPSIIEGHVDSAAEGPSVFYKLGALRPGDHVEVTLADHTVAEFKISGVRQYPKDNFPTSAVYGNTTGATLRIITCGGTFDRTTGHYRSNIVAYASLISRHPAR